MATYREVVRSLHEDRTDYDHEPGTRHPRVARQVVDRAFLYPGMKILDVATGTGLVARRAAERIGPEGHVLGVDLSQTMLAQARKATADANLRNIEYRTADATQLDFEPSTFDAVFCCEALVLFENPRRAVSDWQRFLKPLGTIAFTCTQESSYFAPLFQKALEKVLHKPSPPHLHQPLGRPQRIQLTLSAAGFGHGDIQTEKSGRFRQIDEVKCSREVLQLMFKGDSAVDRLSEQQISRVYDILRAELRKAATAEGVWENSSLYFVHARKTFYHHAKPPLAALLEQSSY